MASWLSIIGIGEDGVEGLPDAARLALSQAAFVFGGARHLALASALITGEGRVWPTPFADGIAQVLALRGQNVAVLASGDPFFYGVGTIFAAHVPGPDMQCWPALSSVTLACARLAWPQEATRVVSLCGRAISGLGLHLSPGARVLVLAAGANTVREVADFLRARGFGETRLTCLEYLGGQRERIRAFGTGDVPGDIAALHLLALDVVAGAQARIVPSVPGLPDAWFMHDGQITKSDIRAVTIAALAPYPGAVLWDVGAGSGSVGIEWALAAPGACVIAVERRPERLERACENAAFFGVTYHATRVGAAPEALGGLPTPDAIFIGGGLTAPGLEKAVFAALRPGGRLVANAVTLEGARILVDWHARHGGGMVRLAVEHLEAIGAMHGFRPGMAVTQYRYCKP